MNYFGFPLTNPFRSHVPNDYYDPIKGHTGIDVIMPIGTPITIKVDTTVELVAKQPEMGLVLYLSDPDGNILVFAHLSKVDVKTGDKIPAGSVMALSGNSGSATTAPHVHFEIIAKIPDKGFEFMNRSLQGFVGWNVDPENYLNKINKPDHWSDEAMEWMVEHEIIGHKKNFSASVSWGEFAVASKRLAEKVLEWSRNS